MMTQWTNWMAEQSIFQSILKTSCVVLPLTAPFLIDTFAPPTLAQSITSGNDGTGTIIKINGQRFDISGGTLSGDGHNLFHSFEQLGLSQGEIANFLANPDVHNIIGSIIGGDPSIIDGLVQITGGSPDLFLINPAGFVFGSNASLDIPGSLMVTTATSAGFGDNWLDIYDPNNFTDLNGAPDAFRFAAGQEGTIVNAGVLETADGESIALVGGNVVNTGTIQTSGGTVSVTAVPGTDRIRLHQDSWVIGLEVEIPRDGETGQILPFVPMNLLTSCTRTDELFSF